MAQYGVATVSTTPTLIVAANNYRRQLILDNQSSTITVFIGPDSGITANGTISLRPGAELERDDRWHRGDIWGVTASGSAVVAFWEVNG